MNKLKNARALGLTIILMIGLLCFLFLQSTIKGMGQILEPEIENLSGVTLAEAGGSQLPESAEGVMGIAPMYAINGVYVLQNGGFEQEQFAVNQPNIVDQSRVPGWLTTASDGMMEIPNGFGGVHSFKAQEGKQWAEINANAIGELYQIVKTIPGSTLRWSLWHSGRLGNDTLSINIGTRTTHPSVKQVTSPKFTWTNYTGTYVVPAGQTDTYFGFQAVSSAGGNNSTGNYLDNIVFKMDGQLTSRKTVDKNIVKTNDIITYKVIISNSLANSESDNIVVEDVLPAGLELVADSLKLDGTKVVNETTVANALKTTIPVIKGNQTVEVSFQTKVTRATNGAIKNVAKVTDVNQSSNSSSPEVSISVTGPGELSATKTVDKTEVKPGDEVTYKIQARNTLLSTRLFDVVVEDQLPAGLTLVANSLTVEGQSTVNETTTANAIKTTIPVIVGNTTTTISFKANVTRTTNGSIKNVAKATDPAKPDTPLSPEVSINVTAPGNLTATKTVDKTAVKTDDEVTYTIQARNTLANTSLTNVIVEDQLPAGLTFVANSMTVGGQTTTNETTTTNAIKKTLPLISGGQTVVISFKAKVTQATNGSIKNVAKVTDPAKPTTPINPEVSINVTAPGNLAATKSIDKSINKTNDEVVYTIKASNTLANTSLKNVNIVDQLPAGVTLVPNSLKVDGTSVTNLRADASNTVEANISLISGNQTVLVTFKAKVTQATEGIIENIATVKDPAKPLDLKKPAVKSLVYNGEAPTTGLLIGSHDFETYKSELIGLSNSELNALILDKGYSYVWDIDNGTDEGIGVSVKSTNLTNNPVEGRSYTAVLEAKKGTQTASDEISIFVHYPAETLIIDSAPSILDFGTKKISYSDIKAEKPVYDNPLVVYDNHVTPTEWVLTATLETPLTSQVDSSKIIPNALRYQVDSENTVILSNGLAQTIVTHTHASVGYYNISEDWDLGKTGFKLEIPAGSIRRLGNYQAVVLWQLGQTP